MLCYEIKESLYMLPFLASEMLSDLSRDISQMAVCNYFNEREEQKHVRWSLRNFL